MNFTLYPYGNAREKQASNGSWTFTCQHGANECIVNMIFACAMHYHPDPADYWPFVECVEQSSSSSRPSSGSKCASQAKWSDWSDINKCTGSKLGNDLMHGVAMATDGLQPRHQWTPWVVMNGKPLSQSQLDQHLVKLVCDAYTGSDKPPACGRYSSEVCFTE